LKKKSQPVVSRVSERVKAAERRITPRSRQPTANLLI
jgi:hypothetical protein